MGSHGDVPVGSTHGSMRPRIPKAIAYGNNTPGRRALFLKTRSGHSDIKRSPPGSMLGNDSRRHADLSHIQFTTGITGGGWLSTAVPSLAGSGAKPAARILVETFCGDMAYVANGWQIVRASDARVVDEISRLFGINLASYRLSAPVTADECADDIVVRFDQLVA